MIMIMMIIINVFQYTLYDPRGLNKIVLLKYLTALPIMSCPQSMHRSPLHLEGRKDRVR